MAVSEAIQCGETESIGNLKDILSGVVAARCQSSCLSLCTHGAARKSRNICLITPSNFYSDLTHLQLLSCQF